MEDVMGWLDSTLAESQFQWEYWKQQRLPDPDGWGSMFHCLLQSRTSVSGRGLLLTGADSYSKQAAAVQMINLLVAEDYETVFLDGMELSDGGMSQARQKLDQLLDHFYDAGKGACLVLEGLEECVCRRELLRFLGQKLGEYRMYQDQLTPLFLILLDDRQQDIPGMLRSCLRLVRLQLPDREHRMVYLSQQAKSLRHYLSLEVFAQTTEGVSYVQLQDLIDMMEEYVDSLDGQVVSDDDLRAMLSQQLVIVQQDQSMQNLCQSVQQLVEMLPKLIREGSSGRERQPQPQPQPQPVPTPIPGPGPMTDFDKIPPLELSVQLFGQEAVDELRNMAIMN